MIENDLQYKITKDRVEKFTFQLEQLRKAEKGINPILFKAEKEAIESMIDELTHDLKVYEQTNGRELKYGT